MFCRILVKASKVLRIYPKVLRIQVIFGENGRSGSHISIDLNAIQIP